MLDCTGCTVTVSIFQRCQGVSRFQCLKSLSCAVDTRDVKHIVEYRLEKDMNCALSLMLTVVIAWEGAPSDL